MKQNEASDILGNAFSQNEDSCSYKPKPAKKSKPYKLLTNPNGKIIIPTSNDCFVQEIEREIIEFSSPIKKKTVENTNKTPSHPIKKPISIPEKLDKQTTSNKEISQE